MRMKSETTIVCFLAARSVGSKVRFQAGEAEGLASLGFAGKEGMDP